MPAVRCLIAEIAIEIVGEDPPVVLQATIDASTHLLAYL